MRVGVFFVNSQVTFKIKKKKTQIFAINNLTDASFATLGHLPLAREGRSSPRNSSSPIDRTVLGMGSADALAGDGYFWRQRVGTSKYCLKTCSLNPTLSPWARAVKHAKATTALPPAWRVGTALRTMTSLWQRSY